MRAPARRRMRRLYRTAHAPFGTWPHAAMSGMSHATSPSKSGEYGPWMASMDVSDTAAAVPHLSVAERVARGRAARAEVPRSSHASFAPAAHRPDPVEVLAATGADARARAGADPLRAHAGLAVHVLPRRRDDHGRRPGGDAALGPARAVLRRRAPVELRRVRLARAPAGVRRQRLRRDAAGTVGVGRQAPGREHADRSARQRLPRQGPEPGGARHRRVLPHRDGTVRAR